jgi:hypothetical protein
MINAKIGQAKKKPRLPGVQAAGASKKRVQGNNNPRKWERQGRGSAGQPTFVSHALAGGRTLAEVRGCRLVFVIDHLKSRHQCALLGKPSSVDITRSHTFLSLPMTRDMK